MCSFFWWIHPLICCVLLFVNAAWILSIRRNLWRNILVTNHRILEKSMLACYRKRNMFTALARSCNQDAECLNSQECKNHGWNYFTISPVFYDNFIKRVRFLTVSIDWMVIIIRLVMNSSTQLIQMYIKFRQIFCTKCVQEFHNLHCSSNFPGCK